MPFTCASELPRFRSAAQVFNSSLFVGGHVALGAEAQEEQAEEDNRQQQQPARPQEQERADVGATTRSLRRRRGAEADDLLVVHERPKKRHHHAPPEYMTEEACADAYLDFAKWWMDAQAHHPEQNAKRCCARAHVTCQENLGQAAGGTKSAIFRDGVQVGWPLCNWCYPPFNKARNFAIRAAELQPMINILMTRLAPPPAQ